MFLNLNLLNLYPSTKQNEEFTRGASDDGGAIDATLLTGIRGSSGDGHEGSNNNLKLPKFTKLVSQPR